MSELWEFIKADKDLLLLLSSFLIVYFTYKSAAAAKKQMEETSPTIIAIKRHTDDTVKILLTNNRPYSITIKTVVVKKHIYKKLLFKKTISEWEPEEIEILTDLGDRKVVAKHTIVPGDVCTIYLTIHGIIKPTLCKIIVSTTAGRCKKTINLPLRSG